VSRAAVTVAVAISIASASATARGHGFGDGGPADRGCAPVLNGKNYVGASGDVGCRKARKIASRAIRGNAPDLTLWKCSGIGFTFGHCHGKAQWKGSTVHWAVND